VRHRVAKAVLEGSRDKEPVPTLIKLLESDSAEDAAEAEELLKTIAGDKSPAPPEDDSPQARKKYRQEWEAWWKGAAAKFDMKAVDFEGVGRAYTLVGLYVYTNKVSGKLLEMDKDGKVVWEMDDLQYPVYACKVRRDRVLVCEYNGNKVTERDLKGKELWKKAVNTQPLSCERLLNGNTFIVTRNGLMEVDKDGKEVKTVTRQSFDVVTAGRHKDGTYSMITNTGVVYRYDANFKETGNYNTGRYVSWTTGLKCAYLPKGGLVLPDYSTRKIREFDGSGNKPVVELDANYPISVSKLPNGNYVYMSRQQNQGIFEITKDGKAVSTKAIPGNNKNNRMQPLFMERR